MSAGEHPSDEQRALVAAAMRREADIRSEAAEIIADWRQAIAADPTARGPRRELARVLRAHGRTGALIEALKEEAASTDDADERAAVLVELGAEYRSHAGLGASALGVLREAARCQPHRLEVLDALEAQCRAAGLWREAADVAASRAARSEDADEACAGVLRAAATYRERCGDSSAARDVLEAAAARFPERDDVLDALDAVYAARAAWSELFELRLRRLGDVDPTAQVVGLTELARFAQVRLHDSELAIEVWRELLTIEPCNEPALDALRAHYERARRWQELDAVLETQAALAAEPARKLACLRKLAYVRAERQGDAAGAERVWRDVLAQDPTSSQALRALKQAYLARRDWPALRSLLVGCGRVGELVRTCEHAAAHDGDAALWACLGAIYAHDKRDPARARRAFERATELDPRHDEAIAGLIASCERDGDRPALRAALALSLAAAAAAGDEAGQRVLHRRLITLAEEAGDRDAAARHWSALCGHDWQAVAEREQALASLAAATAPAQAALTLVRALEEAVARAEAAGVAEPRLVPVLLDLVRACDFCVAGEPARERMRAEVLARVRDIVTAHPGLLVAIEKWYRTDGRFAELAATYQALAAATGDPALRERCIARLAELAEGELDDPEAAVAAYEALVEIGRGELAALSRLAHLHEARGDWQALADVLLRELAALAGADAGDACAVRVDLMLRLAEVLDVRLGDADAAIEYYWEVLAATSDPRLRRAAAAGLERHLHDPARGELVADRLEPYCREAGEAEVLLRVLTARVRHARPGDERAALHKEIAGLYWEGVGQVAADATLPDAALPGATTSPDLGAVADDGQEPDTRADAGGARARAPRRRHPRAAFTAMAAALRECPGDGEALDALHGLAAELASWPALAELLREVAASPMTVEQQLRVRRALARLYVTHTGEPERAVRTLRRILDLRPRDDAVLAELAWVYEELENWPGVAECLARRRRAASDPRRRATLAIRCAHVHERLQDFARAAHWLGVALEDEPDDPDALAELERLILTGHAQTEVAMILRRACPARWQALQETYERMLEVVVDPVEKRAMLAALARIYDQVHGDLARALATWERAFAMDARSPQVLAALDDLARRTGEIRPVAALLEARLDEHCDDALRIALCRRIAGLRRLVHDDAGAIAALAALHALGAADDAELAELGELYEAAGQRGEHAAILEAQLGRCTSPAERLVVRLRLARVLAELGEPARAIAAYRAVLAADPRNMRAARGLERIHVAARDWAGAYAMYAGLLGRATGETAATIHERMARLADDHLDATEAARHRQLAARLRGPRSARPGIRL